MSSPAAPAVPRHRLLQIVRPHLGPLLLSGVLLVGQSAVLLAAPRVAGWVVDSALVEADLDKLDWIALALVGLFAIRGALAFFQTVLLGVTGARLLRDLRLATFSRLIAQTPAYFERERVGELLSRVGSDLAVVQTTLTVRVPDGLRAMITFVGTVAILLAMSLKLTLLALIVVPPIVFVSAVFGRRLERLSRGIQDHLATLSGGAEEALSGIRTVHAHHQEERERESYRGGLTDLCGSQTRQARVIGVFLGTLQFVGFSAFALVLWQGSREVIAGTLSPGELTAFLLYAFAIAGSISALGSLYGSLRELRGASARVLAILDSRPDIGDAAGAPALVARGGSIEFAEVHFAYHTPGGPRPALRGITFAVAPGETLALVGPSGAGKSTIFALLLRHYDIDSGSVRIDGQELASVTLESLRASLAIVPQDVFLFSGTLVDNIRYGRPDASRAEVERAAREAGAHDFIAAWPKGYDEAVGERGVRMSTGQRQRIAIARALVRGAPILLFDEATSALDAASEAVVQESLERGFGQKTVIVIAHRLSTARRADRIAVVDGGQIVATGTHEELLAASPLYGRLWALQSEPRPLVAAPGPL